MRRHRRRGDRARGRSGCAAALRRRRYRGEQCRHHPRRFHLQVRPRGMGRGAAHQPYRRATPACRGDAGDARSGQGRAPARGDRQHRLHGRHLREFRAGRLRRRQGRADRTQPGRRARSRPLRNTLQCSGAVCGDSRHREHQARQRSAGHLQGEGARGAGALRRAAGELSGERCRGARFGSAVRRARAGIVPILPGAARAARAPAARRLRSCGPGAGGCRA